MTTIKVKKGTEARRTEISMQGHANWKPGSDIVCAAISTSICMIINYLKSIDTEMHKPRIIEYDHIKPGDVYIIINETGCDKIEKMKIKTALECFKISIAQIEQTYPLNCKLEVEK